MGQQSGLRNESFMTAGEQIRGIWMCGLPAAAAVCGYVPHLLW